MGAVIKQFGLTYGSTDNAWIVPYPYWVDTRLPGVWAGIPNRDFAVWPENFNTTLDVQGPKLFIVNVQDTTSMDQLTAIVSAWCLEPFCFQDQTGGQRLHDLLCPSGVRELRFDD